MDAFGERTIKEIKEEFCEDRRHMNDLDDEKDDCKESPAQKIKEEIFDSCAQTVKRLSSQEQEVDGYEETMSRVCSLKENDVSRELKSKLIKSELQEIDANIDKMKSSLLDEYFSSNSDSNSDKFVSETIVCKEELGEISLKEEVTEEFFENPLSLTDIYAGVSTKKENSQANTPCQLMQQNSHQEKAKHSPSINKEVVPHFIHISQSTSNGSAYIEECSNNKNSRIETVGKLSESSSSPFLTQSIHKNPITLKLKMDMGKIFKCSSCPYQTVQKGNIVKHLKIHTGEKPFHCSFCSYQAAEKADLKRHLRTHTGEKPFKCSSCPYQAAQKGNIVKHFRTHTGEKPFHCSLCPYQSAAKVHLKNHLRTHGLNPLKNLTDEKCHKCSSCPYQTAHKANIIKHLRTHTGEKPFHCSLCSYQAATKENVKKHFSRTHADLNLLRNHTGEKLYKCSFCPYQAARKRSFEAHVRTHTGTAPFKCSFSPSQAAENAYINKKFSFPTNIS